jgi:hypothetical protein
MEIVNVNVSDAEYLFFPTGTIDLASKHDWYDGGAGNDLTWPKPSTDSGSRFIHGSVPRKLSCFMVAMSPVKRLACHVWRPQVREDRIQTF